MTAVASGMDACEARRLARLYVDLGWSVIPIVAGTKEPATDWKSHQRERATLPAIESWLDTGHCLGVVLGTVSGGLFSRDFDDTEAFQRWADEHPDLSATLPRCKTGRGYHVFCRADGAVKTRKFGGAGELRGEGSYVVAAPTPHKDSGVPYRWVMEPSPNVPVLTIEETGLDRSWSDVTQRTQNTHGYESSESSESSVCKAVTAITTGQHDAILEAVDATVPHGVGHRNDGIFRFARKVKGILGGNPDVALEERLAMMWFGEARRTIGTLDVGVTVQDFRHAVRRVEKPDHGANPIDDAWAIAQELAPPRFVQSIATVSEESPTVKLAKLIVGLDQLSGGGSWLLPCREAERVIGAGYSFRQANRQLNGWAEDGILKLVEKGRAGASSRRANKYQLVRRD